MSRPRLPSRTARATSPLRLAVLAAALASPLAVANATAAQQVDEAYTAKILEYTTEPFFLTPHIDHLPASATVPTPLDVLGRVVGAPEVLSYPDEVHGYIRAVAEASPRVEVFSMGHSEEGREMILAVVANEETIQDLERYKGLIRQLADPRQTDVDEAARIIPETKPIYWATGAIHSPETGSPEMLMELVYRLAVDEGEFIRTIRDNMIVLITPVIEVDGRAKQVDLHMAPRRDSTINVPSRPLYWGAYVAHSNNRDGMGLSLNLMQNIMSVYLDYHPTVFHDLHESASYLYTSTGRGPYNAWVDPIVINEWSRLAYREVKDMTAMGVPGVYTYDFYDGWAPNYMFWIANMRNSIGRFYETQAARNAESYVLNLNVERQWHRPNTPLPTVLWSIRNNVNLQQSALLIGMHEVASNREDFLRNFYLKSQRSVAKATTEGPAAYVFPASDPRPGQQARLLSLLQRHGIEIHRADRAFTVGDETYEAGSYVVRMDQPFSRAADMLLDKQYYNPNDPRPYDDIGWTFGPLFNVESVRIEDPEVLAAEMRLVPDPVRPPGGIEAEAGRATAFLINYNADNNLASFRFTHPQLRIEAAQASFTDGSVTYNAGSFIIPVDGNPGDLADILDRAGRDYGFTASGARAVPTVPTHPVTVPRIAVMHTWQNTQNEGWLRIGLDEYEIPYDYISVHDVRDNPRLRDDYDVIVFGPSTGNALSLLRGITGDEPIAWMPTDVTPNIGRQAQTADMRGGLELSGIVNLENFVRQGGTLITLANSSVLPVHFGLAPGVSIRETPDLWAHGSVFRAEVAEPTSPLVYGYGEELGVYFNTSPVFAVSGSGGFGGGGFGGGGFGGFGGGPGAAAGAAGGRGEPGATTGRATGRGGVDERDIVQGREQDPGRANVEAFQAEQERLRGEAEEDDDGADATVAPKAVLRFSRDVDRLLISGGLRNGRLLANAPALVDVPFGEGHVIMFSFNPFWRSSTLGSYALLFNALLHHGNLRVAPPPATAVQDDS